MKRTVRGEQDVIVWWWETRSIEAISHPPDISHRRELKEGDLFLHRHGDLTAHRYGEKIHMWLWAAEDGGPLRWVRVRVGYMRDDGRRLSLTEVKKWPSWLEPEWYLTRRAQGK